MKTKISVKKKKKKGLLFHLDNVRPTSGSSHAGPWGVSDSIYSMIALTVVSDLFDVHGVNSSVPVGRYCKIP